MFVVTALVGVSAVATAQVRVIESIPPQPPLLPPSDADIVAALQSVDDDLNTKMAVITRAVHSDLLKPQSLRAATIRLIVQEISKIQRIGEDRFLAFQAGTGQQPFEEEGYGEYTIQLTQLLIKQQNPAGIDGLADVVHYGNSPFWAVVGYGDAAVPALVRVARVNPRMYDSGKMQNAMDALEQMLESPTIRPTLTANSHAQIRQLAADRMRTLRGDDNARNLAAAASLAVATGDRQLRTEAAALADNDSEFFRRDISVQVGQEVSDSVRQALEKFPQ